MHITPNSGSFCEAEKLKQPVASQRFGSAHTPQPMPRHGADAAALSPEPAVSEFFYAKKNTGDSDEHAEALVQWDQTYDQMTPGAFAGQVVEMWFSGIQIFRETTNRSVCQNGSPWKRCHIIGIPLAMSGPALFSRQQVNIDNVFTFQSEQGFSLTTPENFDIIGIAIPDDTLAKIMVGDDGRPALLSAAPSVLLPCPAKLAELRNCLSAVLDPRSFEAKLLRYPQVQKNMHSAIIGHIQETLRSAQPALVSAPSFKARSHLVHAAIDHVLAHADAPPTVEELCHKFHISRRMLNYSFMDVLSTNPVHYLRSLRLNGVRRELRRPGEAPGLIREVAAKWGFWHLPRFAAEYRHLFGELPSETARHGGKCFA